MPLADRQSGLRVARSSAGLASDFTIDSAGTGTWHVGERADARMRQAARRRGLSIMSIARQVTRDDFDPFDVIVAIDASAFARMTPAGHASKVVLFRNYALPRLSSAVPRTAGSAPSTRHHRRRGT